MTYLLIIALSYLVGCSNMAYYIARLRRLDLRSGGSGNLGASNAMVLMGWKAGVLVALHDVGKAFLAVTAARLLFPALPAVGSVAGIACVLGHIFPFFLKFRGGKGFAAYLGMTLALHWKFALALIAACLVLTVLTDYIVTATTTTVITVPLYFGFIRRSLPVFLVLAAGTAVILWKHRENYRRILNGTEIGLRSASSGKYRK